MSSEKEEIFQHKDVVINDDEIVLPPEPNTFSAWCREIWGFPEASSEELRTFIEEMDVNIEDFEFCEFQEYEQEERGSVGDILQEGTHCTTGYLLAVWYNYCLIQWFCRVGGNGDLEDVDEVFSPILGELQRLQKHPELFPGPETEQVFWHYLEKALERITQVCVIIQEKSKRHAALVSNDYERMHTALMPRKDIARKPWEQYLHDRAPGVNVDLTDMGGDGSIQILPMAALRLLHRMKEANESIIIGIETARRARGVEMPYQVGARSPTLLGVSALSPEGLRRTHNLRSDLLTSIRNGSKWKIRPFAGTELETLNEDFSKYINLRVLRHEANVF